MKRVLATGTVIKGMDVSQWLGKIDFPYYKSQGYEFVFIRASVGLSKDTNFSVNYDAAKDAGFITGSYHFFMSNEDPKAQAEFFLSIAKSDLPLVIDFEPDSGEIDNVTPLYDALDMVSQNKTAIVYSAPYWLNSVFGVASLSKFKLWIANYDCSAPLIPDPWESWDFWQYQGNTTRPDFNYFNGSYQDLIALTKN